MTDNNGITKLDTKKIKPFTPNIEKYWHKWEEEPISEDGCFFVLLLPLDESDYAYFFCLRSNGQYKGVGFTEDGRLVDENGTLQDWKCFAWHRCVEYGKSCTIIKGDVK